MGHYSQPDVPHAADHGVAHAVWRETRSGSQVTCMKTAQKDSSPMRSQVLYNLGLCLWQLSFDDAAMKQLLDAPVVEPLVALLKEGV